ncbi:MAG: hypothetical protein K2K01_03510, partial [Eubacterium sp.]|nr:hypothetical protein [Eubacterium sp.]
YFLCLFVFPLIYVMPYVSTTQALYYENFRLRALQEGRVTEDDFLSDAQRYEKYANIYANPNNAVPNGNPYQQNGYQPYGQPNQQYYAPQNPNPYYPAQPNGQYYPPQQNSYYTPNQTMYNTPPQQPQASYYTPAPTEVKPEEQNPLQNEVKIEETAYSSEPNPVNSENEPKAPAKDPWEINHED